MGFSQLTHVYGVLLVAFPQGWTFAEWAEKYISGIFSEHMPAKSMRHEAGSSSGMPMSGFFRGGRDDVRVYLGR